MREGKKRLKNCRLSVDIQNIPSSISRASGLLTLNGHSAGRRIQQRIEPSGTINLTRRKVMLLKYGRAAWFWSGETLFIWALGPYNH